MKKLVSAIILFLIANNLQAQNVKEGTTLFNKINQPCLVGEYNFSGDIIEGALIKKMADAKISKPGKSSDGFKLYKGISLPDITKETIDLYYKIDDKKTNATLYVMLSKGYDNFIKHESDSVTLQRATEYFTKFIKDATAFSLQKDIVAQQEVIAGLEKKLKSQVKDEENATKEKSKIESKITANKIETEALKQEMEAQQKALEMVKQKTATIEQMDALKKEVSKQESATEKATKKYNNALEDAGQYKEDVKKAEDKIAASVIEQNKTKASITNAKQQLDNLQQQLQGIQ